MENWSAPSPRPWNKITLSLYSASLSFKYCVVVLVSVYHPESRAGRDEVVPVPARGAENVNKGVGNDL